MACYWGEVDRNIARMEDFSRQAAKDSAQMAVFPELSVTGIYKDDRVWQLAEDGDGPSIRKMGEIARRHALFIGFGFTEKADSLPYNAYCIVGPDGSVAGIYRKNCIPKLEVPWWQGHCGRPVFSIAGRRFAVALCWDTTQPALLAEYGKQQVETVLMPHAWDADPLGLDGKELKHDSMAELLDHYQNGRLGGWQSHDGMLEQFLRYIPLRARENRFYALFVNQSGRPHETLHFAGPTFAVNPEGKLIACTQNGSEQVLYVTLA
jgi:predicted amidohydrolase